MSGCENELFGDFLEVTDRTVFRLEPEYSATCMFNVADLYEVGITPKNV